MIPMSISKDAVNELPLGAFEGKIHLIDKPEQVQEAFERLREETVIGFDTETRPSFRKGTQYKVSLLQLSTSEEAFLFRLQHVGFPPQIKGLLENQDILKVGAAVLDDLRALRKIDPTFLEQNFFDLNEELKRVGFHNVGVRNLSAMVLNIRISKSEQVSNWEADTLTDKQLLYAATDAWACLAIFDRLFDAGYLDDLFE